MKIALGIGCDRGTPAATILQCIAAALRACGAAPTDVLAVATIDIKANEAGLLAAVRAQGWTLQSYPAQALAAVPVANPSETVRRYTGTPSVAEAAALLAAFDYLNSSQQAPAAGFMPRETSQRSERRDAFFADRLLVEKQKLRGPDGRSVTISIARILP